MATSDVIIRLLLNTLGFEQQLGKSKKEISDWQKLISSSGKDVNDAFKGIAGAAGIAFGAMETFNRIVTANEANNDKWENTMRAMNNSVNEFFSALTSGDFSTFQNGLDGIIQKARDTAEALRQIDDAQTVFGLFGSENRAIFNESLVTLRDKNASEADKAAARSAAEEAITRQTEQSQVLAEKALVAVQNIIAQRGNIDAAGISEADIKNMLSIALDRQGEIRSEELETRYAEYVKSYKDLRNKYSEVFWKTGQMVFIGGNDYERELGTLNNQYADANLYNALWNKVNGDELKQLVSFLQLAYNARTEVAGMQKSYNRASQTGSEKKTGSVVSEKDMETFTQGVLYDIEQGIYAQFNEDFSRMVGEGDMKATDKLGIQQQKLKVPELKTGMDGFTSSTMNGVDAVNTLIGAIGNLTGVVDSGASSWIAYGANILQTTAQAIPAIASLTAAKKSEASANTAAAASGAGSAVASIPFAGPALAVAAIASVIAALAAVPKFADGGIVGGSSYYGDRILARLNSGEMVLNQRQQSALLSELDRPTQRIEISGKLTADGRDLSYSFDKYSIYKRQ